MAETANCSRFYFQRLFRERTGETSGYCRRRLLLARAAYQLRYTAPPIIDIAFCAYRHLLRCTGRSVRGQRSDIDRPETIDETAEMVIARGGVGIAVRVDHSKPAEVAAFFQRVVAEQKGQLDTLVNDVWGGKALIEFGKAFGEMDWKG